jgi:hypothetical protein
MESEESKRRASVIHWPAKSLELGLEECHMKSKIERVFNIRFRILLAVEVPHQVVD